MSAYYCRTLFIIYAEYFLNDPITSLCIVMAPRDWSIFKGRSFKHILMGRLSFKCDIFLDACVETEIKASFPIMSRTIETNIEFNDKVERDIYIFLCKILLIRKRTDVPNFVVED